MKFNYGDKVIFIRTGEEVFINYINFEDEFGPTVYFAGDLENNTLKYASPEEDFRYPDKVIKREILQKNLSK